VAGAREPGEGAAVVAGAEGESDGGGRSWGAGGWSQRAGGWGGGGGRSRGREQRRWPEPGEGAATVAEARGGRGWRWWWPEPEEGAAAVVGAREEGALGQQWSSTVDVGYVLRDT
jgi:hypothetical protein